MKISIDVYEPGLLSDREDRELYHRLMSGCLETRKRLGKLSEAIEAFRIKWLSIERMESLPKFEIEIHIWDPLERKFHYKANSKYFEEGVPWSEAIPNYLCKKDNLPKFISRYWNDAFPVSWQKLCLEWQVEYPRATQAYDCLRELKRRIDEFVIERQKRAEANLVRDIGCLLISQGAPEGLRRMMEQSLETYA